MQISRLSRSLARPSSCVQYFPQIKATNYHYHHQPTTPIQNQKTNTDSLQSRVFVERQKMSLACLVCHSTESPAHSFRSYSVSSSDNEGRCSAMSSCLTRRPSLPAPRQNACYISSTSKVTPHPGTQTVGGPPRLVRSRAVRRDIVRDWNFDQTDIER